MIKLSMQGGAFSAVWTGEAGTATATGATRRDVINAVLDAARDVAGRGVWLQDEQIIGPDPAVGMGAAYSIGSDTYSYTVVEVLSPTRIALTRDTVRGNGTTELFVSNFDAEREVVSLRKDGTWREVGQNPRSSGRFVLGERAYRLDPTF